MMPVRSVAQRSIVAKPKPGEPRGFTQVEILVTITIIVMLASLFLPMLGRAREVARGAECKNQFHNLAIAAHDHHHQFGEFPTGVLAQTRPVRSDSGGDGLSLFVRLLPFLEQKPLYDLIDLSLGVEAQRSEVRDVHVSILRCPSDRLQSYDVAASNYAGCHDHRETPIDVDNDGMFFLGRGLTIVEMIDGTSHTLMFAEKSIPPDDRGWLSGSRATLRNTGEPFTRFEISPEIAAGGNDDPLAVGSFSSAHPYGVHVALADSSVQLLSFEVDHTVLQRLADRADGELIPISELTRRSFDPVDESKR
ncbi:MAG: DUF1559 domain-containing protein [Planctomycetaceae bacterium]|nr:DUF1559 domain-containing protein [Planctomycetaceae bacterium]